MHGWPACGKNTNATSLTRVRVEHFWLDSEEFLSVFLNLRMCVGVPLISINVLTLQQHDTGQYHPAEGAQGALHQDQCDDGSDLVFSFFLISSLNCFFLFLVLYAVCFRSTFMTIVLLVIRLNVFNDSPVVLSLSPSLSLSLKYILQFCLIKKMSKVTLLRTLCMLSGHFSKHGC